MVHILVMDDCATDFTVQFLEQIADRMNETECQILYCSSSKVYIKCICQNRGRGLHDYF